MTEFLVTLRLVINDAEDIKYLAQSIQDGYELINGEEYVQILKVEEVFE